MDVFDDRTEASDDGSGPELRWTWGGEEGVSKGTLLLELRFPKAGRPTVYHLHLLLDVSTSMREPERFGAALEAVRLAVAVLRETDRFSLTLFSHEAESVVLGATAAWCRDHLATIEERIRNSRLLFSPKTYLGGALHQLMAIEPKIRGWITRVVVLTDGEIMDAEACGRLSSRLPRGQEIRALGFGGEFRPERVRDALEHANLGPVQAVASVESLGEQVEHLATTGEWIIGKEAMLSFTARRGLHNVLCVRPSIRGLQHQQAGAFVDRRPLVETGRSYVYLVEIDGEDDNEQPGQLEVSYRSTKDGRKVTFLRDFSIGKPWLMADIDPHRVAFWYVRAGLARPEEREGLGHALRALHRAEAARPDMDQARLQELLGMARYLEAASVVDRGNVVEMHAILDEFTRVWGRGERLP